MFQSKMTYNIMHFISVWWEIKRSDLHKGRHFKDAFSELILPQGKQRPYGVRVLNTTQRWKSIRQGKVEAVNFAKMTIDRVISFIPKSCFEDMCST